MSGRNTRKASGTPVVSDSVMERELLAQEAAAQEAAELVALVDEADTQAEAELTELIDHIDAQEPVMPLTGPISQEMIDNAPPDVLEGDDAPIEEPVKASDIDTSLAGAFAAVAAQMGMNVGQLIARLLQPATVPTLPARMPAPDANATIGTITRRAPNVEKVRHWNHDSLIDKTEKRWHLTFVMKAGPGFTQSIRMAADVRDDVRQFALSRLDATTRANVQRVIVRRGTTK